MINQLENTMLENKDFLAVKNLFKKILFEQKNEEIVFLCIGTDRSTGDALGPMIGTLLEQSELNFPVYGTIEKPVDALNLREKINEIELKYPNHVVIAIDSGVGDKRFVGKIFLKEGPLAANKFLNKTLPSVGHYHLCAVVSEKGPRFGHKKIHEVRLYETITLAQNIVELIQQCVTEQQKIDE